MDNIILCAGQVERDDLSRTAAAAAAVDNNIANKVYTIGGAYKAGELDAKRAINMGVRLAHQIHDPQVLPGQHVFEAPAGAEQKLFELMQKYV